MFNLNFFRTAHEVPLSLDSDEVMQILATIGHEKFQRVYKRWFRIRPNNTVSRASVAWLACWAQTACSSEYWARECRRVFDLIFPFSYADFEAHGYLKRARSWRYRRDRNRVPLDESPNADLVHEHEDTRSLDSSAEALSNALVPEGNGLTTQKRVLDSVLDGENIIIMETVGDALNCISLTKPELRNFYDEHIGGESTNAGLIKA